DAMAAHQPRLEFQKIPFGTGSFDDVVRVYTDTVKNQRQLIDKRNIDVALRVFDGLRSFCHLDAGRLVRTRYDDRTIEGVYAVGDFRCGAAGYFLDVGEGIDFVPGANALGWVSHEKIAVVNQA